jgi:hypothetical protein
MDEDFIFLGCVAFQIVGLSEPYFFGRSCSFSTACISKTLLNIFRHFPVSLKIGEKTTNTLTHTQTCLSFYSDLDRNPLNFCNWNETSFLERTEAK